MPVQKDQYNLKPISSDAIYKLLPIIVRVNDPRSAMLAYFQAMASEHNFYLDKMAKLPRLQDPTKTGTFSPADFGEDLNDYKEYLILSSQPSLSAGLQERLEVLRSRLPKSVAAEELERKVLALLGNSVGADLHNKYGAPTNRKLVQTAIFRHHVKGTHGSIYVLGRILGFVDLKVRELWSRFQIKDPKFPAAAKNDSDFSDTPEEYPYWPQNKDNVYDGKLTRLTERTDANGTAYLEDVVQYPPASPTYNPHVLDDGPQGYTVIFNELVIDNKHPNYFNDAVNERNPFGSFMTLIESKPILGTYYLGGGDELGPAFVNIPLESGATALFQACARGTWANGVEVQIKNDVGGTHEIQITGPQSKIKFKSSFFDFAITSDVLVFPTLFKPVPVTGNPSGSLDDLTIPGKTLTTWSVTSVNPYYLSPDYPLLTLDDTAGLTLNSIVEIDGIPSLDGLRTIIELDPINHRVVLKSYPGAPTVYADDYAEGATLTFGRVAGEYPVTGSADGTRIMADPTVHKVLNFQTYLELVATLRDFFEKIRPLTRTPRFESYGFMLRDNMPYAPVVAVDQPVIQSLLTGVKYKPVVDANNGITWVVTDLEDTVTDIVQTDNILRRPFRWIIDDSGGTPVFQAQTVTAGSQAVNTQLVYVRQDDFSGFLYLENRLLRASGVSPENSVDAIHSDGTDDESGELGVNKAKVHEDLNQLAEYLSPESQDAVYPDPRFLFQSSPEDDLTVVRTTAIDYRTELAANFRTSFSEESDQFINPDADFQYNIDPDIQFQGADLRLRHVGADPAIIEPMPTGDPIRQDGLYYEYPVEFLDYSGTYVWRSRADNKLYRTHYTYDSPDPDTGGTRVDVEITEDGQIEGLVALNTPGAPTPISSEGFGPTPNNQAWDKPGYEHIWQRKMVRDFVLPSFRAEALEHTDGNLMLRVSNPGDVRPGALLRIVYTEDTTYEGIVRVVEMMESTPGVFDLVLDIAHTGDDIAYIGALPTQMNCWRSGADNGYPITLSVTGDSRATPLSIQSAASGGSGYTLLYVPTIQASALAIGAGLVVTATGRYDGKHVIVGLTPNGTTVGVRVATPFTGDCQGLLQPGCVMHQARYNTSWSLFSEARPVYPSETTSFEFQTVDMTSGGYVAAVVHGAGTPTVTLSRHPDDAPVVNSPVMQGHLLVGGGDRDSLEITILPADDTQHFGDFAEDVSNFGDIDGHASWRGGAWRGTSEYTITDRSDEGLPHVLDRNDGNFPVS